MPGTPPHKLSRREREIMDVLFSVGEAAAEEIRGRLTDPPTSSAVRAMLTRLEAKGHIKRREEGLRYVYAPTLPRAAARKTALKQYVRTFFDGSLSDMVTSLLRSERWSDEELATLQDEITRARNERNK